MEKHKLVGTVHSQHNNGQNLAMSNQCWSHFDSLCSEAHFEGSLSNLPVKIEWTVSDLHQ